MTPTPAPSQLVLTRAEALNARLGHENLGFLSERRGLAPAEPPLTAMQPSHRAWDEVAAELPTLFRTLRVREAVDALPLLRAGDEHLADHFLCRAAALLSILAHAYVRSQPAVPATVPDTIRVPWEDVTRRLGRPMPFLSYIDLIVYNWRPRDARRDDPMRVENLDLLLPTVGNQEERVFYLTQVEMLAQCAPAIVAATRAQTAALNHDVAGLVRELLGILERLRHVTEVSFQKISPNPHSSTYVDPVVWAKTVAPFAVPIDEGAAGPSGTASPLFHALDLFFERPGYESLLGHEMLKLRGWYPSHWTDFLDALGQVSVGDFVRRSGDRELAGLYQTALDAYASDKGFLGAHRLKVYGYLEMAFKVGRSVTIGGFQGLFQDRTWNEIDGELARSKAERLSASPPRTALGIPRQDVLPEHPAGAPVPIALDLEDAGVQYRPGDRCGILPENGDDLIARTLEALRATGDERVTLDRTWRESIRDRHGHEDAADLPLRLLLRFGRLRPVSRDVARRLRALSGSSLLGRVVNARAEDQWELWELLELLSERGFDPRRLWRAEPWEAESICRVVPPEEFRLYSISSAMSPDTPVSAGRIDLTVAPLAYETAATDVSASGLRHGTASSFLRRAVDPAAGRPRPVSARVVPAPRFHLPADASRPVVMFAGGAGIAPFRGFMQQRARDPRAGKSWLFLGVRDPSHLTYRDEIEEWVRDGKLYLHVAFSNADARLGLDTQSRKLTLKRGHRRRLDALIESDRFATPLWDVIRRWEDGGLGAHVYICGRADFAASILSALRSIIARHTELPADAAHAFALEEIARMTAEGRLLQDVFTSYSRAHQAEPRQIDASELALHNSSMLGYWMAVNGRVYDVTEFRQLHLGGPRIIRQYAGIDATHAYQAVLHHRNPEVDSQLGLYEIGAMRRLDFGGVWGVAIGERGLIHVPLADAFRSWVSLLYLIVEMENALSNDVEFLHQSLTADDAPLQLTPQKVQLALDTHRAFVAGYIGGLTSADLQRLWAITSGLCRRDLDVRALSDRLSGIDAGDAARAVRELPDALWRAELARSGDDRDAGHLRPLCELLQQHDRQLLVELKALARRGVTVFEQHEARAIDLGAGDLVECALAIPAAIERYYAGMARDLAALEITIGSFSHATDTDKALPAPAVFVGHGAAITRENHDTIG